MRLMFNIFLAAGENDQLIDIVVATTITILIVAFVFLQDYLAKRRRERKRRAARPPASIPPVHTLDIRQSFAPRAASTASPAQPTLSPGRETAMPTLDLATFAPMSDAQIKAAAQGVNLFTTFSFGLRSQIPPVSDRRTLLIDKALVSQGLLTPEDLVEIHKIGEPMDEGKTNPNLAVHRAEQAVARTLEEKQRLKERKKAEAAERKRLHDQAVAHRKATDIFFLGRGVSKGLADRRSNPEKLTAANLPLLSTPADIATALNLTIPRLRWLAFHS